MEGTSKNWQGPGENREGTAKNMAGPQGRNRQEQRKNQGEQGRPREEQRRTGEKREIKWNREATGKKQALSTRGK